VAVGNSTFRFLVSPYGRISRKAYWLNWFLPYLGVTAVAMGLDAALFPTDPLSGERPEIFENALTLITLWPSLAITARRLHDRGMTGWWQAAQLPASLVLVGVVYWYDIVQRSTMYGTPVGPFGLGAQPTTLEAIAAIIAVAASSWVLLYPLAHALFLRGEPGSNKYGDDPLGHPADTFT
jgi:uncharacterized membrane protein YhaH (DUF805 family)